MHVLGIETSCDETGVALYQEGGGIVWEDLYSQVDLHRPYAGVVPELASRDHVRRLAPLLRGLLEQAPEPDVVAYTAGPGLIGALLVGAALAEGYGAARGIPTLGVNHLEAHLLAPLMTAEGPDFPFLGLLVSGGHTLIVGAYALGDYRVLGTTLDDAAGEAFDKSASLLGLDYPGGPALARLAASGRPGKFHLPRPLLGRPGYDFSFSGLKTALLYAARELEPEDESARADLAREFEEAVVEVLTVKAERALDQGGFSRLVVAGGVAANRRLHASIQDMARRRGVQAWFPSPGLCTDNGAMVAYAGWRRFRAGEWCGSGEVRARWPLGESRFTHGGGE